VPRAWLLAVALALGAACWGIGSYPLLEPDEGRNAEVAREMARGGDWVLPHLNGLPYLDKPAPFFAAVALSLKLFGESEGAARIPSLLCTIVAAFFVWRLGRRLENSGTAAQRHSGVGEIAAVALLTMPLAFAFSRTVIFDAMLMMIETLTLLCAWRALETEGAWESRRVGEQPGWGWAAGAWAAMGVGAVTKGPVAIAVPLLIIAAYGLISGARLRPLFQWRAWPWLFVTGLPWFVAVTVRRPDFPRYAFIYESIERVATTTHGRAEPWWFFLAVAPAAAFPWTVPALAGLWRAGRAWSARRDPASRPVVFLASWSLVPLIFFSLSQSKLPHYYLPALPGVALGAALGVATVWPAWRWRLSALFAVPVVIVAGIGPLVMPRIAHRRSSASLAAAIDRAAPGAQVVLAGTYPTSLRWYLDRPLLLATATGRETTSNYVASRLAEFRALPDSPLREEMWWRDALTACERPTVFVARRRSPADSTLSAALPLIATGGADDRTAAYGPCRPRTI
jgi:4-amino-4-deoxy-L-arabinose transferase-like glycosyltransferase